MDRVETILDTIQAMVERMIHLVTRTSPAKGCNREALEINTLTPSTTAQGQPQSLAQVPAGVPHDSTGSNYQAAMSAQLRGQVEHRTHGETLTWLV